MRLDRIGPPGRCSGCWRRPRRSQLRGQLRHDPIAPAGSGGSGVLSLRHFGLVLFIPWRVGADESGAAKAKNKAIANQSPLLKLSEESDSKERLRVSNWIVQRLYNYAVQKTVEL